ncbi:hypothetical protein HY633_02390 [Candidatus Uhrbacteria bacterium]|nr:hypothetical protein [Candidatus Uhrbacteria bacterium]
MQMKFNVGLIAAAMLAAGPVFAIGSGGGGSVPSCSEDSWSCGEWSQCSSAGQRTRGCVMTFDCAQASTPKPAESEGCEPPAPAVQPESEPAPAPQPTPTPTSQPTQKPAPKPAPAPRPTSVCSADTWKCDGWTPTCDANGNHTRSCAIAADCPTAETPGPAIAKPCERLQCGDKAALADRISCRLNLTPAGQIREYALQYLPEECRVIPVGPGRTQCVARYKSFQPCWDERDPRVRQNCAAEILQIGPSVADEARRCQGRQGKDRAACAQAVKDKVYTMIKFRFYDLEERAEELLERGANQEAVTAFITAVETKKQEFNNATATDDRRRLILEVRLAWKDFLKAVGPDLR